MIKAFASKLRKLRGKRTQEVVAKNIVNVPLATYRNWETRRRCPSRVTRDAILKKIEDAIRNDDGL